MKRGLVVLYFLGLAVLLSGIGAGTDKPVRSTAEFAQFGLLEDSCVDIGTACKKLRIYNQGRLSDNAANASLDFTDAYDPDSCANIYLHDGSPIVCRPDGDSVLCFTAIYDKNTLVPTLNITVDSLSNASYTYAVSQFMTSDSAIGFIAEYFAPKHPDSCGFIIQKLRFWNRTKTIFTDVAFGEVLDWNIPSWPIGKNESGYDESRQLMYQYGCDYDECDSLQPNDRYAGIAPWRAKHFMNYMTLDNATYVSTAGPFGTKAPLPPDTIYQLMENRSGFYPVAVDSCQNLISLVTFGVARFLFTDTICFTKILTTSREDATGLVIKANVDKANAFIAAHREAKCPLCCICDCRPGDANNDGSKNVGDAVYIINHVFKGGSAPVPYARCSGDPNGDCFCNVADAVYWINYIFRFGVPPVSCDTWMDNCGQPLR